MTDPLSSQRQSDNLGFLETMTRNLPVGIFRTDGTGMGTYFNDRWCEFTGMNREEALGRGWTQALHPEDQERVLDECRSCARDLRKINVKYRFRKPDGKEMWVQAEGTPEIDANGTLCGFIGTVTDISEQKKIEEALQMALDARDEFLSVASHELKAPLTALSLQLTLLRRTLARVNGPAELDTLAEKSVKATHQLATLINKLLDITRIRAGILTLHKEEMDLQASVVNTLSLMSEEIVKSGSSVDVAVSKRIQGFWDPTRIGQITSNLVSNALKYGGAKPIQISISCNASVATLEVADHGLGISKDLQEKLFQRFERGEPSRKFSGLGLGLYIVNKIALAHGGTVSVDSELDRGSTFMVRLPLRKEP